MLYLIKKELTANVRYMLLGFLIFVVYMFVFAANGNGLFMLCLVFCFYSISATNLLLDERYKIDLLTSTLPIRRKDVVMSKYLLLPVIFIACLALYMLLSLGFAATGYAQMPVLNLKSVMLGLFMVSLFNGVMLPLHYRFGAQTTRYVSFLIFFVLFFVSSLLGQENAAQYLGLYAHTNDIQIGLVLFGGAVLINVLSFCISYPIYAKKDF